jgi:hypothetical protein
MLEQGDQKVKEITVDEEVNSRINSNLDPNTALNMLEQGDQKVEEITRIKTKHPQQKRKYTTSTLLFYFMCLWLLVALLLSRPLL